jgi:hypothetical protein
MILAFKMAFPFRVAFSIAFPMLILTLAYSRGKLGHIFGLYLLYITKTPNYTFYIKKKVINAFVERATAHMDKQVKVTARCLVYQATQMRFVAEVGPIVFIELV